MEAGVLKEAAPPSTLLADPESMFSKLVDKTGPEVRPALKPSSGKEERFLHSHILSWLPNPCH